MLFPLLAAAALCRFASMRPEKQRLHETDAGEAVDTGFDDNTDIVVNDSVLLFRVNLDWMVKAGFGSRVWIMGGLHAGLVNGHRGRVMAMTPDAVETWREFDLQPPVTTAPLESFQSMFDNKPEEGPSPWLNHWAMRESSIMLMYQLMAGCWKGFDSFMLNLFEQAMTNFKKPFDDYIGMHVRHGDKSKEGRVYSLDTFMSLVQKTPKWQDKRNFFIATDDSRVSEQFTSSFHPPEGEYQLSMNEFARKPGGEHGYGHDSSYESIQAVIDDTISLALAPVLVANFNSNFMKIPWVLNYLRRTPEQRREQWCWDVFTNQPCHSRHDFVMEFLQEAVRSNVTYKPGHTESMEAVRKCEMPSFDEDTI